jgi:alkylation response protein AidB-like acyl-CoA dehydrogenase
MLYNITTEPSSGSDAGSLMTSAVYDKSNDSYVINGGENKNKTIKNIIIIIIIIIITI